MELDKLDPATQLRLLEVVGKIDKIEAALLSADPMLTIHCQEIRKALLEQEELVHILPDDKIRMYMAGVKKYTAIKIAEEVAAKGRKKKVTADDL